MYYYNFNKKICDNIKRTDFHYFAQLFPLLFDSVCRMFHQKLCFQSPKTFTPKKRTDVVNVDHV